MLDNDIVQLIYVDNKKIINKKIMIPFSRKEIIDQHNFVNYLYDSNIKVARIINLYKKNNYYYELQEFIEDSNEIYNIESIIKMLAIFHKKSKQYCGKFKKSEVYDFNFKCNNIELKKLLLGYDEKYNIYPLVNYMNNEKYFKKIQLKKCNIIVDYYYYVYNYIKNKYKDSLCIIHNDITKNNVINTNNGLFLIDFDLCCYSYEIVDIADAIMIPYNNLDLIIKDFKKIHNNVKKMVKVYNRYNNIHIQDKDIIYQIFLKVVSYNFYVLLNKSNLNQFYYNISNIYIIMNKIKEKYT